MLHKRVTPGNALGIKTSRRGWEIAESRVGEWKVELGRKTINLCHVLLGQTSSISSRWRLLLLFDQVFSFKMAVIQKNTTRRGTQAHTEISTL